ncbi:MAG TPA: glutamate--tRNA ligase [Thermomicrobiales bacterium]|nr:glutamate--tRNA ligase [Thermomicrobiales bacterium]
MKIDRPVRTRFAPSPTGDLHVGSAHTTLFNWLFTRHHGGTVVLRIEDTDQKRLVQHSLGGIPDALAWLGIDWDEGPEVGGPFGPYFQSERTALYQAHAQQLVEQGHAYYCFCTPERLEEVRRERSARGLPTGYDRHCRNLTPEEVAANFAAGLQPTVRLKVPDEGQVTVDDLIRGPITVDVRTLEDAILLKSDGYPTYHLANVVDDHLMEITHILRGEEWIPTAPLHVLLYRAFGWEMPAIAHLMLLLGPDRKKLSKRHGSTSLAQFRENGILPEALVNYLAIIGWSWDDKQEIFSLPELIEKFDLDRVKPSSAIFDHQKLEWMNGYYINHILSLDELTERALPWLAGAGLVDEAAARPGTPGRQYVEDVLALEKERIKRLSEIPEMTAYFFADDLDYSYDVLVSKKQKLTPELAETGLARLREAIAAGDVADEAGTEARLTALAEELGLKRGQLFMLARAAVTGRTVSPGLFETVRVLGRERCLRRLDAALAWLREHAAEYQGAAM